MQMSWKGMTLWVSLCRLIERHFVLYSLKLVDIKTGEEDEDVMYKQRARLYRYAKELSVWKERGIGDLKLMRHRETGALRLVMRREQVRWGSVL